MYGFLHLAEKAVNFYFKSLPRRRPAPEQLNQVKLIAHRGAHDRNIPENTLEAFGAALAAGCYGIEFDIHASADGVPVVNHDPTLKRIWGVDLAIADLSAKELRKLAPRVPFLSEVVEQFGGKMHFYIEVKASFADQAALLEVLKPLKAVCDYHIICLDDVLLASMEEFSPASRILVAVHNNTSRFCSLSLEAGYGGVLGHCLMFNSRHIEQLKAAGQLTGVGFVDSKNSLYREVNRGLTLLFSDRVSEVKSVF